jgi:hypothetical protein
VNLFRADSRAYIIVQSKNAFQLQKRYLDAIIKTEFLNEVIFMTVGKEHIYV